MDFSKQQEAIKAKTNKYFIALPESMDTAKGEIAFGLLTGDRTGSVKVTEIMYVTEGSFPVDIKVGQITGSESTPAVAEAIMQTEAHWDMTATETVLELTKHLR